MALDLLLASEVLDAHYDDENAWLYLDWKGPQALELVQAACAQISVLLQQTGARKILNDNTHITETSWELARWVAYDYLPEAARNGLNYVAWVNSPLLSCRGNVNLMAAFIDRRPQVAIFDELAAAYEWLSSLTVAIRT
ncbi:hypothetical protein AUC43_03210 [Hymenobacter sedentarius]|uniref:STAS/SEC14 domain-containing protein n=1 Tax=Hymenobacter sedentarius TaxID=1411621 RepID=A0A0U4CLR2_9BACT|nr:MULTISPECIES: hypothetical protein [Hymenobacter]ALW84190.1 hypothetical protein AUC43_03210 [Hymenobacter sedentarius]MCC3154190.1 hypothetical protein [Hymenobacter sp. BT770]MDO3414363.1 hypothetical protein [Hymenobacter sp. BT770]